jgi:hypothetical protein
MWTLRAGIVSGEGQWPAELIDFVIARLAAAGPQDERRLAKLLAKAPQRKVLISSCGLNPGDSGGPLVDWDGKLIAVSYAVPRIDPKAGVDLAQFSYHVHLEEVKKFVEQGKKWMGSPTPEPPPFVPDAWPAALYHAFADLDSDGTVDALMFSLEPRGKLTGILFDLDQNSRIPNVAGGDGGKTLRESWDFELALHTTAQGRALYDTNDDGRVDLILSDLDQDGLADVSLARDGEKWTHKKLLRSTPMIQPKPLKSEEMRKRLLKIAQRF